MAHTKVFRVRVKYTSVFDLQIVLIGYNGKASILLNLDIIFQKFQLTKDSDTDIWSVYLKVQYAQL